MAGCTVALLAFFLSTTTTVRFERTDELLANPGMGWQTFHTFADNDRNLAGLPSSSAYFRFYWREIEPAEGRIDFAKIDSLLAQARAAGQQLCLRIMCAGGEPLDVPQWLKDSGCRGTSYIYEGQTHWIPDFEDPIFQKAHLRLIRELGKRYGNHPDLDLIDIGSVGLWGEWHMSGAREVGTDRDVPLPSLSTRKRLIDAWNAAFPHRRRVMLIGGEEALTYAVDKGCGWRADCLGDMGGFSKNWNHMDNLYPEAIRKSGAAEAWRKAPVAFESCWDMRKWQQEGWDIGKIFDYALLHHASYMNNKSAPIPEGARPEVDRFLRKLGYRLVLEEANLPREAHRGKEVTVAMRWENVGVAPPYGDYRIALRISGKALTLGESVRGWMPGKRKSMLKLPLPKGLPKGIQPIDLALVHPSPKTPAIRLAIKGRQSDGWYRLGMLTVR